MTTPLGKLHRHAVDVLTIYPYHSVNSIDTLCQACNMMLVLCLVSPDPLASVSFCRFIVSLSFYRYRYRYTEIVSVGYFLSYRFQTIIPKLSVQYPFLLFSCPCIGSAQITPSTYKRESIVLCLQALEMIPIRQLLNLALPPWGRQSHFFPSYYDYCYDYEEL